MLEVINSQRKATTIQVMYRNNTQIRPVSFIFLDRSKTMDNKYQIDQLLGKGRKASCFPEQFRVKKKKYR